MKLTSENLRRLAFVCRKAIGQGSTDIPDRLLVKMIDVAEDCAVYQENAELKETIRKMSPK